MGVAVPRAPEFGTPSKVRSRALVCCSTAISKSSFTKNKGDIKLDYIINQCYTLTRLMPIDVNMYLRPHQLTTAVSKVHLLYFDKYFTLVIQQLTSSCGINEDQDGVLCRMQITTSGHGLAQTLPLPSSPHGCGISTTTYWHACLDLLTSLKNGTTLFGVS